ncbi:hypothetical protein ABW21_db0203829 [Orbilia brochopaga]|nr:hypothetical protein ABW21_db0203829 [Drechslerella brochopaga]
MSGKDLKNFALTCRTAYEIVKPTLYRTLRLHFDRYFGYEGLREDQVESVLATRDTTLSYVRHFNIEIYPASLAEPHESDGDRVRHRRITIGKDDIAIMLIFKRLRDCQLQSISFPHNTSTRTFAWILAHQSDVADIDFGDVPADITLNQPHIESVILESDPRLELKTLAFGNIDIRMATTMIKIINSSSDCLEKLKIGPPESYTHPLNNIWDEGSNYEGDYIYESPRTYSNTIRKINLPLLEQLEISYDEENEDFLAALDNAVRNFSNLKRLKLINCYSSGHLISRAHDEAVELNSLQLISYKQGGNPKLTFGSTDSLHTLQLIVRKADSLDFPKIASQGQFLRRLWLECLHICSSGNCISRLFHFYQVRNPDFFHTERWPHLQELAITIDSLMTQESWTKSVKILRLLVECWDPKQANVYRRMLLTYTHSLCALTCHPAIVGSAGLKLVVMSPTTEKMYDTGCPQLLFFTANIPRMTEEALAPTVNFATYPEALTACRESGSSTYLLAKTVEQLHRVWEDAE